MNHENQRNPLGEISGASPGKNPGLDKHYISSGERKKRAPGWGAGSAESSSISDCHVEILGPGGWEKKNAVNPSARTGVHGS